ncbi:hypothetical protein ACIA03_11610 [Nocardioides sp. NPDC051685]|uniref:hypothetical protein n=1 Tax=Nocardioides sp. NPDC051685 TaxID=3364334 RepID=UPI0037BAA048
MRVAIIYRPRNAAPVEVGPMLMGALGQWVETHSKRFEVLEFFVAGGGLVLADFDDTTELNRILAENPFTPYMDVEILPVLEPKAAMANFSEVIADLLAAAQPAG